MSTNPQNIRHMKRFPDLLAATADFYDRACLAVARGAVGDCIRPKGHTGPHQGAHGWAWDDPSVVAYRQARDEIRAEYERLIRDIGSGFHPDSLGTDYTSLPSPWTADRVDAAIERAFAADLDVYGIALDVIHSLES